MECLLSATQTTTQQHTCGCDGDELSHVLHVYMPVFTLFNFLFNTNAFVQVRYCFFYLDIHVYCTFTPLRGHVSRGRSHTCDVDLYHLAFTLRSFIQSRSISEVESRTHSHLVLSQRTFALILVVTCHTRGHSHMRGVTVYKTRSYSHLVLV